MADEKVPIHQTPIIPVSISNNTFKNVPSDNNFNNYTDEPTIPKNDTNNKEKLEFDAVSNTTAKQIIQTATDLIKQDGLGVGNALALSKIVKNNPIILNKLTILKRITILDTNTTNYLHSIKLTDEVKNIEPKLNVIWNLTKSAGLITDDTLAEEMETDVIPERIPLDTDVQQLAIKVLQKMVDQ